MDLNYIVGSDSGRLVHLEKEGYDIEALLCLCGELFSFTDELSLSNIEVGEFVFRLKTAKDSSEGKATEPFLVLYENSKGLSNRLSVEERATGKTFFFKLIPYQGRGEECFYKCEGCPGNASVLKSDARAHIQSKHLEL
jgi:hypothetical protein